VEAVRVVISGNPNPNRICTSHVERQNLTMRMQIRRLTRLTNAFSKKFENHKAAIALHFAYYNFVKIHQALRVTPAMEAGITDRVWTIAELLA
jgi:IS1 transposase